MPIQPRSLPSTFRETNTPARRASISSGRPSGTAILFPCAPHTRAPGLYGLPRQVHVRIFLPFPFLQRFSLPFFPLPQEVTAGLQPARLINADAVAHTERAFMGEPLCLYRQGIQRSRHDDEGTVAALRRLFTEFL